MGATKLTQKDFDEAQDAVQRVFREFAKRVQDRLPSVRAIFGTASNERFPLYSYVTFEDKNVPDVDPAVAAVDIRIDGDRLAVKTDLIGEESGEVYLEPVTQPIALGPAQPDWLARVTREAQSLADRALPVLEHLFECAKPLRTPA